MAIFNNNNKTTKVAKPSFAERLDNIKATFQTALNQTSALNDEMQKEIENKEVQIEIIKSRIEEIKDTQGKAKKFMSNLENLIK